MTQATFLLIGGLAESLLNFRGALIDCITAMGHRVIACAGPADAAMLRKLESRGVEFLEIPIDRGGMNPLRDLLMLRRLMAIMRRVKPDVVLAYTVKPVVYGSIAAQRAANARVCSLITGMGSAFSGSSIKSRFARWAVTLLYRNALAKNAAVIFQNPDDCREFRERGILPASVDVHIVNGSGVDLEHFAHAPLPSAPVFLMAARLLRDKGVREFAEAAARIRAVQPETRCLLAGWHDSTNPEAIARSELDGWIREGSIEYLGHLADVRPAVRQASVYVLPSYREGMPRSVLEAMAMGRPIITTDVPGCRHAIEDGISGLLVPCRSPGALADAMLRLARDAPLRSRMGAAAHRRAVEVFDVHDVNRRILDVLKLDAVDGPGSQPSTIKCG